MNKIIVKGNSLEFMGKTYQCAIGKNGFSTDKREGDNCTPVGTFPLRELLYRPDQLELPETNLRTFEINQDDGWCDAPTDKNYNLPVKLPYAASHEKLWRDDGLYNVVIPLGYNDDPVVPGKGSAIFMHIARPNYEGTEGCIALKLPDLLEVIKSCNKYTVMEIKGE